jgi:hypothetical protein
MRPEQLLQEARLLFAYSAPYGGSITFSLPPSNGCLGVEMEGVFGIFKKNIIDRGTKLYVI